MCSFIVINKSMEINYVYLIYNPINKQSSQLHIFGLL